MNQEFLSPLLLEADRITLPLDGSWGSFNPQQLMNPNRTPMLIDELRFSGNPTVGLTGADEFDFMSLVCKITFGNSNMTNDFVPLPVLAPTYLSYGNDKTRTFHLPKPLYVPPGVQINCTLQRKLPVLIPIVGPATDPNTPWGFSIAGRSIPAGMPVPQKIFMPWVCATSVYSDVVPFTSKDNEIGNPFDSDMRFTQLTGFNMHTFVDDQTASVTRTPITIQATYGSGKMLIRDPVPFLSLFPPVRPIAQMQGLLKPKDFLKVTLDLPQPTLVNGGNDAYTNMIFTSVGMVGYRTLDTPLGALP